LNVAVTALGTALVPYLSALVARREWSALQQTVAKYLRLSFGLAVIPTALLAFWASPLVRVLFERGAFGPEDTRAVAGVQALASLQIPFYLASIVVVRTISSLSSNRLLMYGAVVSCALNVVLNYVFMQWLGVAGIALSTSVMYLVSFGYLFISYARRLARLRVRSPNREVSPA
jgi:putative peptidoglycan lipid II flippase